MKPVKNDLDQEKISKNARIVYFSHGGGPLPLHVCLGMANAPGTLVFDDYILGKRGVAFLW